MPTASIAGAVVHDELFIGADVTQGDRKQEATRLVCLQRKLVPNQLETRATTAIVDETREVAQQARIEPSCIDATRHLQMSVCPWTCAGTRERHTRQSGREWSGRSGDVVEGRR